jgi:putative ABC transport system substrate-binding protein
MAARLYRIGVLGVSDWDVKSSSVLRTIGELERLGYVQGRNLQFIVRVCGTDLSRLDSLASELVNLRVDLILSDGGTPSALAAKRATSTIPIVMRDSRDPVADGLVSSLAKPGGNVTGNASMGAEMMVKRLQLLIEAVGARGPVGYVPYQPHMVRESEQQTIAALESFARSQGLQLIIAPVRDIADGKGSGFENALASLNRQGAVAALINNYSTIGVESFEQLAASMMRYRLPSIMEERDFALGGILMTYTESSADRDLRTAGLVAQILNGAKPADLPVSQATRFELVINLNTAKAMGIAIPQSILLRADEVVR